MNLTRPVLALFSTLLVLCIALPASAQDTDPKEGLTGTWRYVGGKGQINKMIKAIEDATDDMNFITRPIARSRLEDTNEAYRAITIAFSGGNISVKRDSQAAIVSPESGAGAKWTSPDDKTYTVTQQLKGNKVVQSFAAGDGRKTAAYVLGKSGDTMTLSITVSSPKLPKKVTYFLSYKKK